MSPLFRRVHRPPLLPTTDRFPLHQYCLSTLRCLGVWCRFASYDLWNAVLCFQQLEFAYRKGLGTCDALLHVGYIANYIRELAAGLDRTDDFNATLDRVDHQRILFKLC